MSVRKIIAALLFMCLVIASSMPASLASEQNMGDTFTVQAVIPDNQIDTVRSYFDLLMSPGQSQTISVNIINYGSREITVDVSLIAASTNRNGSIEYQIAADPDETLKIPFNSIAGTAPELKVAPNGSSRADISITMPEGLYDGVILGGIVFTRREEEQAASGGISINNRISYVVGVKLSETDKVITPDFALKSVEPSLINYRKAVTVSIQNPKALIIKGADVSARVYKKNGTEPLFSVDNNSIDFAPNSVYPMPIEWQGRMLEAGDYLLNLKLTHEGKVWEWNKDYTIEQGQANDINSSALDKPAGFWSRWWHVVIWIPVFMLLLWIAFILGRRGKKEDYRQGS